MKTLFLPSLCVKLNHNSTDMVTDWRNSSWCVFVLSGYLTIFSAGTNDVWGGIINHEKLVTGWQ